MHVHHALQKKWNKMDTSSVDGGVLNCMLHLDFSGIAGNPDGHP